MTNRAPSIADNTATARPISPFEIGLYAVLPLLFVAAGAMPSTALFFLPAILPLLYMLYRRFGAYFPLAVVAGYGIFSLALNYDVLTVLYLTFLTVSLCGLIISAQFKPYLLCAAIVFLSGVFGAFAGAGIVRLAAGPISDVAARYVVEEYDDPMIRFLTETVYDRADFGDEPKYERTDPEYSAAATEYLSELAADETLVELPYYCVHFAGIICAVGYFAAVLFTRRTSSPRDPDYASAGEYPSRCKGGAVRERTPISQMKFPRAYLWAVLLPAFVVCLALEIVGGFDMLAATIMHAFVTVPTAFCFVTLGAYFCTKFKGKARYAARAVYGLVCIAMAVFPVAMLVCSIIGVCDVIVNLRFWTEFLTTD